MIDVMCERQLVLTGMQRKTEILSRKVGNVGHKGNVTGMLHAFSVCVCACVKTVC